MSKVLITGVAGFIGSSIARALLAEGAEVRGLDNLSTGKLENIEQIRNGIDFRHGDVQDAVAVADACKGVDYVFHEAAIPSVPVSVADPVGTNGPNLIGTLQVLEAARQAGVKRVVYAASSAAYGDSPELPKREDMAPAPLSAYAVQKLTGEYYLTSYAKMYGLETVSLRYFNIFGPRQDPTSQYSGVLARFISQMLAGTKPTIFGDGSTSRDFTYIDNVVSANLLAAKSGSHVAGKVFNVATGTSVTLLEAYEEVRRITGYAGDLDFKPERVGDIKHSVADISLARKELGYGVVADFAAGLEETIAWYRTQTVAAV
ncbi:SDR family oxidoreductase [Terriglobus saanensis]|uniref:NAD-dependent epimerase/dehydratase n=1 Tax=Terriglobus saanensis (strain ATCC BAA-1853 / DSM 23119 / SP1PR4) TaxID=401053 RepID=E8V3Z4_TERSS|nr:SDR family oxidoreductase [Terriglobus saanensis]ADV81408.1 NAD-dependent epimerase/dehydratase [Terriglobus saanensis SP1PR4]